MLKSYCCYFEVSGALLQIVGTYTKNKNAKALEMEMAGPVLFQSKIVSLCSAGKHTSDQEIASSSPHQRITIFKVYILYFNFTDPPPLTRAVEA